jgi:polysaccharide export outer membrane protein
VEWGDSNLNRRKFTAAIALPMAIMTAGCTTLPSVGPSEKEIEKAADPGVANPSYELIDLTPEVASALSRHGSSSLYGHFGSRAGAYDQRIGVGDVVDIAIFEAGPGLFSSPSNVAGVAPSNSTRLPPQTVDRSGQISVPYAGRIRAAGRTPYEVQRTIESRLRDKAIEPQAVVTISQSRSSLVTVTGDVRAAGQFPMALQGTRLLDALALAGGGANPPHETFVRVNRRDDTAVVSLARIVREQRENIYLRPNDTIVVTHDPQTFTAFGAAGQNGTFEFEYEQLSAAEALGKAGGLVDTRASPTGIFIYRLESPAIVRKFRPDSPLVHHKAVPVIYRIKLKSADGFFLAQQMKIRDKDIVYIANADSVQLLKFLDILGAANTAVGGTAVNVGRAF